MGIIPPHRVPILKFNEASLHAYNAERQEGIGQQNFKEENVMAVDLDFDGQPMCPDCSVGMDCESAGRRDTETIGGHEVQYFKCTVCKGDYQLIDGDLSWAGECI